jgi:hypothetical protein
VRRRIAMIFKLVSTMKRWNGVRLMKPVYDSVQCGVVISWNSR